MADSVFPTNEDDNAEFIDSNLDEDFIDTEPDVAQDYGFTWKFDFSRGDIFLDSFGNTAEVSGHDCLREWIGHTLGTERWETPIFGGDIGTELNMLIGASHTLDPIAIATIEKEIKEAIEVHDRIDRVERIAFIPIDYDVFVYLRYTTDDAQGLEEVVSF